MPDEAALRAEVRELTTAIIAHAQALVLLHDSSAMLVQARELRQMVDRWAALVQQLPPTPHT